MIVPHDQVTYILSSEFFVYLTIVVFMASVLVIATLGFKISRHQHEIEEDLEELRSTDSLRRVVYGTRSESVDDYDWSR